MKKHHIPLALLALAFLFPPADRVTPATRDEHYGERIVAGDPERRANQGFVFFTEIGGNIQIRWGQWFVLMGACGCVAYFLSGRNAKNATPSA
jgi:hypothetical protein